MGSWVPGPGLSCLAILVSCMLNLHFNYKIHGFLLGNVSGVEVVLAQHLLTEARLVLLERLLNWRSAWKIHVQVEMLEIAKFVTIVFSLVSLVPVDQL